MKHRQVKKTKIKPKIFSQPKIKTILGPKVIIKFPIIFPQLLQ